MNSTNAAVTSAISQFTFDHQQIRIVTRNGEPWFVASEVCKAIGETNTGDATAKLDPDEKGLEKIPTLGGQQNMVVVSESGLNIIILRCHDAIVPGTAAHRFRKWVTSEVLPSIRKTGQYQLPHVTPPPVKGLSYRECAKALGVSIDRSTRMNSTNATITSAANSLIPFNFESQQVRIITIGDDHWFVAKDVVEALGATWNGAPAIKHVPEEWKGVRSDLTPGGKQDLLTLSEQGLYFFLGRSDKPKALPFQKWIAG
ncbi:MAG: PhiV10p23, partial [Magnetococcales bacterium]|nr:PhiV10p23 [Magnetococcales bacterium]